MQLQELLDITNNTFGSIEILHRNTLGKNELLHSKLSDIKDFLYSLIDDVGEFIIIQGGMSKFEKTQQSDLPKERKKIYNYSLDLIENYLNNLKLFYTECDDLEIQSYIIDKTRELRKELFKLKSVCPEMTEMGENDEEEKEEIKIKPKTIGIKLPKL